MVRGIRKEGSMRLAEEGGATAVLLCKDNLVEKGDGGIGDGFGLAKVDELIEGCENVSIQFRECLL